ncbi:hypothetical protein [Streptobacillus moniliformis]|uniref:XkdQ/YqbQ family protein n=1 Tax=Streptobacillus moniliformis TaxID=34105 RepID=UPI0007E3322A|nr:hypothetical protein [Streptobacillus moniliformis]
MADKYEIIKNKLFDNALSKKKVEEVEKIKKVKTKGKSKSKKVAKKIMRDIARKEYRVTLNVDGDFKYVAGSIIELDDSFGKFEGIYIIERVTHNVDGDYSCDIEATRISDRG